MPQVESSGPAWVSALGVLAQLLVMLSFTDTVNPGKLLPQLDDGGQARPTLCTRKVMVK